jgi:hypothetical protein
MRSCIACTLEQILDDKIKEDEMGGRRRPHWEIKNVYRILLGTPEFERSLGRLRCRWEDNIKMDLMEIWFGGVDFIHMAQGKGCCGHGNEPSGCVKDREFLDLLLSFSRRTLLHGVS